jgi:hypothetical protein
MCECSKRHLQRNGGQLASHNNIVVGATSAEHVNGYIKHVMRHHKGRGGGHCPLINRTATTPVRHHHHTPPTNKNVSLFILFKIILYQLGRQIKVQMLGPHLSFNHFRLSVFYSLVNSYSVDYVTRQKLNLKKKNKQNNGRPGTGNSVKEEE